MSINKPQKKIVVILCGAVVILLVFKAGVLVGYKKASFSDKFGNGYYQVFAHKGEPMRERGGMMPGGHGVVGKVINIQLPQLTVMGPDGVEQFVTLDDNTMIRKGRDRIEPSGIQLNDAIIVLGMPGEGNVGARLIRVMPAPRDMQGTSTQPIKN